MTTNPKDPMSEYEAKQREQARGKDFADFKAKAFALLDELYPTIKDRDNVLAKKIRVFKQANEGAVNT
jgi:hypothetical protein